ncbi:hypothetical protein GMDG_05697 [Pseudogymnoascus destructans 20631-21]|uniref:Kinase n=1 Tax=Pseudogymnoascus destructans (strain ATCC MYA-4855 / 20631-21) TaxID=658429 RepID=L8FQK8_PSED2|nr:hypothetical protein GMDG_05697 [Pseudogymnoascus destructans 20631-21]
MAKPLSEPAHAPGGVQNGARPPAAAAGNSSRGLLPQRRATSSSPLTKLLAPTYEVDETTADGAVNADAAVGDDALLNRAQREHLPRETKDMAAQTMRPLSLPQQAARYNLHDMNISSVNALLHDHRAFMRVRGNSLERTSREKMGTTTASLAQRDVSGGAMTNPGDTGYTYTRPATDGEGIAPGDISERPPTEGFRADYRSWRDGQRMPGAGMAWSIGDEALSPGEDGQVEKSITQALAGETHNSRSRKSSHSVRLFKEGLPDETARRSRLRDEKGAAGEGAGEAQTKGEEKLSPIAGSIEQTPAEDVSDSYFDLPVAEPTSTTPPTSRHHAVAGRMSRANTTRKSDEPPRRPERQNTLPAQLLDDLRSRHNLTPAATKGSSFSNSIPLTDSERQSTADLSISVPSDDSTAPATSGDEKPRIESPNSDEESSEEKISSALFVPHQSSREPGDESPHNTPPCREPLKDRRERGLEEEQWLVEHEVAPHEVVEQDVTPANLSPELVSPKSRSASGFFSQTSSNRLSSSDASYPSAEGEEQVPVTQEQGEDVDITSTERRPSLQEYTVKTRERAPTQDSAQQQPSPKAAGPLEAIELIPYKHQVGGHTTLWRFSKRAVCKQLNNRENQFYETVEHYHPALLKFMPRYIGVLNVTFEKQLKRKPTIKNAGAAELSAAKATASQNGTLPSLGDTNGIRPRVISQSLATGPIATPTVTFADNRHIIPKSFMQGGPIPVTETPYKSLSDSNIHVSPDHKPGRGTSEPVNGERPTLSDRHAVSWGATTVNRKLRYEVFGEAFLRQPVQVQPHKKPGQHHLRRDLAHRAVPPVLRATTSDSNLNLGGREGEEDVSLRMQAIKAAALRRGGVDGGSPTKMGRGVAIPTAPGGGAGGAHGEAVAEARKGENGVLSDEEEFAEQIGTSAPEAETVAPVETPKGKKKRRYSSGGLRRKPEEGGQDRGSLKYFAEADDPGYTGDAEEDVFAMDPDVVIPATLQTTTSLPTLPIIQDPPHHMIVEHPVDTDIIPTATDAPTPPPLPVLPRPANPKEAQTQTQPDSRVEYFLLLEDLTAGMRRPCIMDLKMGTRQYGVDADSAKQASQRRKCAATTSRALGVRVCGLQVWDRESQGYIFQDKYYGRDLTEGEGFRGALRRVRRLVERIGRLEVLIGGLEGYRFYAASLLMFYDGASEEEIVASTATAAAAATAAANGAPPPPPTVDPDQPPRRGRDIDFKIADFANCVTAENGGVGGGWGGGVRRGIRGSRIEGF